MQNIINSIKVLVQVAEKAQKSGILTLKEAQITAQAVEIQEEYVKQVEEEMNAPVPIDRYPEEETIDIPQVIEPSEEVAPTKKRGSK